MKKIIGLFVFFLIFSFSDSQAQMTTWQMDNFKKNEKNRKKRAKTKGPKMKTKGGKHKASKSFKGGKTLFSKKRYDISLGPRDAAKFSSKRKQEELFCELLDY